MNNIHASAILWYTGEAQNDKYTELMPVHREQEGAHMNNIHASAIEMHTYHLNMPSCSHVTSKGRRQRSPATSCVCASHAPNPRVGIRRRQQLVPQLVRPFGHRHVSHLAHARGRRTHSSSPYPPWWQCTLLRRVRAASSR